ncbi:hypothetical protein HAX54_000314, partial [Datura stramonium]|nr:hypothetical protein [Datura stramonium]
WSTWHGPITHTYFHGLMLVHHFSWQGAYLCDTALVAKNGQHGMGVGAKLGLAWHGNWYRVGPSVAQSQRIGTLPDNHHVHTAVACHGS